jgi:7-cyano-7-deazaguanine synthase
MINKDKLASLGRRVEDILEQERGYVFKIPRNRPLVALVSGGMDSAVAIDKVIREWGARVYPLFVKRKAKAERHEEKAFDEIVNFYKKRYPKNFKRACKVFTTIPPLELKSYFKKDTLKAIGYPLRDASLQNIGVQYAFALNEKYNLNIKAVLIAMSPDETFPHCGILSLRVQTLNACIDTNDWEWQIFSPFIEPALGAPLYKKNIILWAVKHGIPLEATRTCVSGRQSPDGSCQECLWRLKAFQQAGVNDPLKYRIRK